MKLTLRELFLLIALVAMGCGWWVERQRLIEHVRVADERVNRAELETFWVVQEASMAGVKLPPLSRDETVLGDRNPSATK